MVDLIGLSLFSEKMCGLSVSFDLCISCIGIMNSETHELTRHIMAVAYKVIRPSKLSHPGRLGYELLQAIPP